MSYPGPPGVSSAHPSLPPRPPAALANNNNNNNNSITSNVNVNSKQQQPIGPSTTSRFSSTFASAGTYSAPPGYNRAAVSTTPSYPSAPGYPTPPNRYGATPTTYSSYPAATTAVPVRTAGGYGRGGYNTGAAAAATGGYNAYPSVTAAPTAYGVVPQIRNPFPGPGTVAAAAAAAATPAVTAQSEEAEMAAQIAQWQSAYIPKSEAEQAAAAAAGPILPEGQLLLQEQQQQQQQQAQQNQGRPGADGAADGEERKKTVYRAGGGKKWADDTLVEWDPTHLRMFVGNLAGETTDESLLKAFSRWKSVQKSKVIRDKRTNKSKGYGFVSFSDPDDFFQAAKEMNGKYIQSHPVICKKATTEIKVTTAKDNKRNNGGRNDKKKSGGNGRGGGGGGGGYEPHLGPQHPGGIVKPGQKTKGGLKLLG